MYIPKDIHKKLKFEAEFADRADCKSWARLFRQCSYLIRQQERQIAQLNRMIDGDIDKWLDKVVEVSEAKSVRMG